MTEYNRAFTEEGKRNKFGDGNENDLDPGKNRKSSSVPRRAQEHMAIAEFFHINKFAIESPGRKYNRNKLLESLKNMKTELDPESEKDKSTRWMDEVISPEEQAVSEMTEEVFESRERQEGEEEFESEQSRRQNTRETMSFGDIAREGNDNEDDNGEDLSSTKSVQIGAVQKAKLIRFSKLNNKAFKVDVIATAKDELKKLDLKVTLLRKQRRNDRKQT